VAFDANGDEINDHVECEQCGAEVAHGEFLCNSCQMDVYEERSIDAEMNEYWD